MPTAITNTGYTRAQLQARAYQLQRERVQRLCEHRLLKAYPNDRNSVEIAQDTYNEWAERFKNPPDQIENYQNAGFVLQPKQLEFAAAARLCDVAGDDMPNQIGFGGARGGGKSTITFAQMTLDDCQRQMGLKCLYLRQVQKKAKEQFDDLLTAVFAGVPSTHYDYTPSTGLMFFPKTGSRIIIGHFKDERDIAAYLGLEYDLIVIEEMTAFVERLYRSIRDANRTSKPEWRPRIYNTTNPGGVGHGWYKRRFIIPFRKGKQTRTRFIPSTVDDNRFVNDEYVENLEENKGWELRAYRYGDWDIAAGMFFDNFRYDLHVFKARPIPRHHKIWASLDYGYSHWNVIYILSKDDDGRIYLEAELAHRKTGIREIAAGFFALLDELDLRYGDLATFVAGGDVFSSRATGTDSTTIDHLYREQGIRLTRADVAPGSRVQGASEILNRLDNPDSPKFRPTLFISDRCTGFLERIEELLHDPHNPQDVKKVDCDDDTGEGGDDFYDAARYGIRAHKRGGQAVTV